MQAGRGAFTPTQLVCPWMQQGAQMPQQAAVKPPNFMATADKMWKPPALKSLPAAGTGSSAGPKPAAPAVKQAWGEPSAPGLSGSPQLPTSPLNVPAQPTQPQPLNIPQPKPQRLPTPAATGKPTPPAAPQLKATATMPQQSGFDFGRFFSEQVPQFMQKNPAVAGALLSSNPGFTTGLTKLTGGVGLAALTNVLMNGGKDFAQFLPSSQSPAQP